MWLYQREMQSNTHFGNGMVVMVDGDGGGICIAFALVVYVQHACITDVIYLHITTIYVFTPLQPIPTSPSTSPSPSPPPKTQQQ